MSRAADNSGVPAREEIVPRECGRIRCTGTPEIIATTGGRVHLRCPNCGTGGAWLIDEGRGTGPVYGELPRNVGGAWP